MIEFAFVVLLSRVSINMHAERDIIIRICPSVRPSVRHTLVLHRNKCTYRQKLFPPSAKSMTGLFERYHVTKFRGKLNGGGKFAIFDRDRRLSRKRYEMGPQLLWNTNRKSYVADRSVSVPMTLSDYERDNGLKFSGGLPV